MAAIARRMPPTMPLVLVIRGRLGGVRVLLVCNGGNLLAMKPPLLHPKRRASVISQSQYRIYLVRRQYVAFFILPHPPSLPPYGGDTFTWVGVCKSVTSLYTVLVSSDQFGP